MITTVLDVNFVKGVGILPAQEQQYLRIEGTESNVSYENVFIIYFYEINRTFSSHGNGTAVKVSHYKPCRRNDFKEEKL